MFKNTKVSTYLQNMSHNDTKASSDSAQEQIPSLQQRMATFSDETTLHGAIKVGNPQNSTVRR